MKSLKFKGIFIEDIKSGRKTQTIRKWKNSFLKENEVVTLNYTDIKLKITSIEKTSLRHITKKNMQNEGLTLEEFQREYIKYYNEYKPDDVVYIVKFRKED